MKPSIISRFTLLTVILIFFNACDVVTIEIEPPPLEVHKKDPKPLAPVALGCIRGYFGDYYRTFAQHIETVQPVDSFSNCYFYGSCNNTLKQINLIRCDREFVLAIYILGYSLDSLPATLPVPVENGKYAEIQFYPFQSWNSTSPGHYTLDDFYGKSVFITEIKDDVVTGTFEGILRSSTGDILPVTEGEFKLSLFRKYMPCGKPGGK
jgi:hypothetical protein